MNKTTELIYHGKGLALEKVGKNKDAKTCFDRVGQWNFMSTVEPSYNLQSDIEFEGFARRTFEMVLL